jgi:hypothetical protein
VHPCSFCSCNGNHPLLAAAHDLTLARSIEWMQDACSKTNQTPNSWNYQNLIHSENHKYVDSIWTAQIVLLCWYKFRIAFNPHQTQIFLSVWCGPSSH